MLWQNLVGCEKLGVTKQMMGDETNRCVTKFNRCCNTYMSSILFISFSDENKRDKIAHENYSHRHNNCSISGFWELLEFNQDVVKIDGIRFN